MSSVEFPSEIVANTKTKAVTLTPEIQATLPNIDKAFAEADRTFLNDPEKYFQKLETSVFKFRSSEGADVVCSFLHSMNSKLDELFVIFAPFADRNPKSTAHEMGEYITSRLPSGIIDKERVAPNSWNQTTKSAVIFELLSALGKDIPVLTIYGPVPSHAYSFKERKQFRSGDFSPAGRLAKEAINVVQARVHGPNSESQIDAVHLSGASLGASNAIGAAASKELAQLFEVPTVSVQELIMGPKNLGDLARRFTVGQYAGEPSSEKVFQRYPEIEEPSIRKSIDKNGSELIGTNARMLKGMKPTYMMGLTKPEATAQAVERLLDNNVELVIALAENSSLTSQTPEYLPGGGERLIALRAENGQRIGHLADEYVALSGLVAVLNVGSKVK